MSSQRQGASDQIAQSVLSTPVHNGVGRGRVAEIQRARILTAIVDVVAEHGIANVTVAHIVARSGVSRRTFYELFKDREDGFLAAFDDSVSRIAHTVVSAYEGEGGWRDRVRAGLSLLLGFLEDEPAMGRLVAVESLGAGPRALEHRRHVVDQLVAAVEEGRTEANSARELPALTGEGVVGAVLTILHARLSADRPEGFVDLLNPLMGMIVLPYMGSAAARREFDRPTPTAPARSRRGARDPLRALEMRLTYRTVRVLLAVAVSPGSSNRTVAEGSGITDQGQISKLLGRLHGLGLIENTGAGAERGEPNAWTLTEKGWEVHRAISHQTAGA